MDNDDAFYVGYSKPYTFFIIILGIGFVFICVWGFLYSDRFSELSRGIVLSICAIFFLSAILIGIRRLFINSYFMKIDHQGIIFKPWSNQIILWQDIQSIFISLMNTHFITHKFLGILLIDSDNNLEPKLYFKMRKVNRYFGADIFMDIRSCDRTLEEINNAISHYSGQMFCNDNDTELE